jgi:predicted component of type VI protein secretion system
MSGRRIEIISETLLGRVEQDLTIEDPEISRRHAAVRPVGDDLEVEDLGSTNGTFVNEERIEGARKLAHKDVIRVGQTMIEVQTGRTAGGTVITTVPPERAGGTAESERPEPPAPEPEPVEPAPAGTERFDQAPAAAAPPDAAAPAPPVPEHGPGPPAEPSGPPAQPYPAAHEAPSDPAYGGYAAGGQQPPAPVYGQPYGGPQYQASGPARAKSKGPLLALVVVLLVLAAGAAVYFFVLD